MTGKNIQSIQEIMLEFIVMNYREVFASLLEDDEGSCISRKKVIPPSLFQKIIYKSEEMKWCIDIIHKQKLMTFRDVLSWKNIDAVLYPTDYVFSSKVLKEMSQVEYPIRTLSISVGHLDDESMSALCLMGSTIECLDLKYRSRNPRTEFLKGHFPNLRKLNLKKTLIYPQENDKLYIELSRFSDTLEELKLENEHLDDRLIKSIACLKKLKVLSLQHSYADYSYFYESLCEMDNIRTLDIRNFKDRNTNSIHVTPSKLLSVISKMPNLDNFDTSPETFTEKQILETVKCRNWKKFGFYDMGADDFQSSYDKFKLFADQVFGLFEETMLSTFEIYAQDNIYGDIIFSKVLKFLPFIPQEQIVRVENIILNIYAGDICYYSYDVREYIKIGRCTDDLITKIIIIIISNIYANEYLDEDDYIGRFITDIMRSAPIARKMLEIVEKDLNKGLCRKLLKMILICSFDHLTQEINELGISEVYKKALQDDFIDDEALTAMKILLKKINQKFN